MQDHSIDRHGVEFTSGWESFVPYPYDDKAPLVHGKPPEWKGEALRGTATIGFGHTDKGRHPLKVKPGIRVTREEAYEILDVDMSDVEQAVRAMVKVPLTQGQFNALCDLGFNMGATALRKSSLMARLNRGDYAGARAAFDLYVMSQGQRMKGLARRRDAEQLMWDEGGEAAAAAAPAQEDFVETPKDIDRPAPPKGLLESRTVKGAIAAASSAGLPAIGAGMKAADDAKVVPTATETITQYLDRAGNVIDTVKSVQEAIPAPPAGFLSGVAHLLTDPVVAAAFGITSLGAIAFIIYERRRKLHHEGV